MRDNILHILFCVMLLIVTNKSISQIITPYISLTAYRYGNILDPKTNKPIGKTELCGEHITTDTIGFFTMISGCERNVYAIIGQYTLVNDTINIKPFNFKRENAFTSVNRTKSKQNTQTIRFLSADLQALNGRDSSWIVRGFKRRKSGFFDFSSTGVVTVKRGKFDGIELLQLSKLFGGPIILFLDKRFDYEVILNVPKPPLCRYIISGVSGGGRGIIKNDSLILNNQDENYKITSIRKYN